VQEKRKHKKVEIIKKAQDGSVRKKWAAGQTFNARRRCMITLLMMTTLAQAVTEKNQQETKIFFNTLIQDENSKRYGCYLYGNFRGFKITLKGVEKYAILDLK